MSRTPSSTVLAALARTSARTTAAGRVFWMRNIVARRAVPSIRSITSSSSDASADVVAQIVGFGLELLDGRHLGLALAGPLETLVQEVRRSGQPRRERGE